MEHLSPEGQDVKGETVIINKSLFFNSETKELEPNKKVLVYMVESPKGSKAKRDISGSQAMLDIVAPDFGRVS